VFIEIGFSFSIDCGNSLITIEVLYTFHLSLNLFEISNVLLYTFLLSILLKGLIFTSTFFWFLIIVMGIYNIFVDLRKEIEIIIVFYKGFIFFVYPEFYTYG